MAPPVPMLALTPTPTSAQTPAPMPLRDHRDHRDHRDRLGRLGRRDRRGHRDPRAPPSAPAGFRSVSSSFLQSKRCRPPGSCAMARPTSPKTGRISASFLNRFRAPEISQSPTSCQTASFPAAGRRTWSAPQSRPQCPKPILMSSLTTRDTPIQPCTRGTRARRGLSMLFETAMKKNAK